MIQETYLHMFTYTPSHVHTHIHVHVHVHGMPAQFMFPRMLQEDGNMIVVNIIKSSY